MFAHLKVCIFIIERNVDGEGGGVMMGSQVGLSLRCVFNHKVHYSVALQGQSGITGLHSMEDVKVGPREGAG